MPAQQDYLTDQEREPLTTWIADGAAEDDVFRAVVMADLYYDRRCYRCHGDWEQGDGLHAFLIDGEVSGERYVVPGDPDSSLLLQKLEEAPPWGERMPLQFELLSHAQQERIRQWISDGAANN
jgi:hypothetical protein